MASSQDKARVSSGSSSKAMKLLGLSKLPPDASRSDHLSLIRQHRSVRKERAKSSSPLSLKRSDSASRLGSYGGGLSTMTGGGGTPMAHQAGGGGGHEQYPDEDAGRDGGGSDSEDEEEGMMPHQHQHHRHQNSEWLDMRESSMKITPTDLDEQFLQMITGLMSQFPEPPNPDYITDLTSPATAVFGRRGLHMSKPGSHRRGGGGGGGGGGGSGEVVLSRQNPMYQLQADSRRGGGVRELESPMRIRYNKPGEQFSL